MLAEFALKFWGRGGLAFPETIRHEDVLGPSGSPMYRFNKVECRSWMNVTPLAVELSRRFDLLFENLSSPIYFGVPGTLIQEPKV